VTAIAGSTILQTGLGWQMGLGERAAVVGLVSDVHPALAIEVGTAQGGSLGPVAAHSAEVHSIDLAFDLDQGRFPNVRFHEGDSHALLPALLDDFARSGRNVDFVLIDGDHSERGVRLDLLHVLDSPAARHTIVLLHDMMNPRCRRGVERAGLDLHAKVAYVDLDLIPSVRRTPLLRERWGGLGVIVIDERPVNFRVFDEAILRRMRTNPGHELLRDLAGPVRSMVRLAHAGDRRARSLIRPRA
jgi:hypothetical protein